MTRSILLLSLAVTLAAVNSACDTPTELADDATLDDGAAARVLDGTPEAIGVLAYLNDAGTTEAVLDAFLDRRAARGLAHHRNGPDGVFGTLDDDLYDDITEVDDQHYVGNSALNKLAEEAAALGWVPTGSDVVGTWDGVDFTLDEMTGTLQLANDMSHGVLDVEFGLDRRAADSITAARPIADMNELASLYYVGGTALRSLRDNV